MTEFIHAIDIPRRITPGSTSAVGNGSGSITPSPGPASFNPLTPSSLSASSSNPFDFTVPSLPPRLSRVGRRISEIGMNVLAGADFENEQQPSSSSSPYGSVPSSRRESAAIEEVPGMGDEPIMCPFCNKPLPPAFVITQMAHIHAQASAKERKRTVERKGSVRRQDSQRGGLGLSKVDEVGGGSVPMSTVASAPAKALPGSGGLGVGVAPVEAKSKSMADITTSSLLASTAPGSRSGSGSGSVTPKPPAEDVPKATAESLLPMVKEAETADIAGAASIISPEEVKRWSTLAGISLSSTSASSTSGSNAEKPEEKTEKIIPAIPPPPPPTSTAADRIKQHERSGSTSKLGGIFRRGSAKPADVDESEEEDGYMGGGGYAKLNGPASPDREEMPKLTKMEKKEERIEDKLEAEKKDGEVVEKAPKEGKQDEELRKLLVEVLGKVNSMSKSHEDLLHSHTTLLTSLKIARSNLAMAEANSEMLEEQLKRVPVVSAAPSRVVSAQTAAPSRSQTPVPTINAPTRKSLDESRPMPPPSSIPRRSEDVRRPASLIMPPTNLYNNGPQTGPATTRPSTESKGMFGFLGGKTKLPGGLGTISIPSAKDIQATASRFGDTLAGPPPTRPGTPGGAREGGQFFDYHPPAQYSPIVNPQRTVSTDSLAAPPSRSASPGPSSPNMSTSPNLQRPIPVPPALSAELTKLRLAYSSSQTRMEAMNKELTELKKGKIEMEAELESLSQALFEEANKMVAEERRRRAELEESLKEVKEEREALRETIKVLGGDQVDIATEKPKGEPVKIQVEPQEDSEEKNDWRPRDLDKHYEALRKTIHHVADGTAPSTAFTTAVNNQDTEQGIRGTTGIGQEIFPVVPRVEMSPVLPTVDRGVERNPWAEPNFGMGAIREEPVRGIPEEIDPLSDRKPDRVPEEEAKSQEGEKEVVG